MTTQLNKVNLTSYEMFFGINGRCTEEAKDAYFLRYIGMDCEVDKYIDRIIQTDQFMSSQNRKYLRISGPLTPLSLDKTQAIASKYEQLKANIDTIDFSYLFADQKLANMLKQNYIDILALYQTIKPNSTESILKNFGIKMLFWIDEYFPQLFDKNSSLTISPKCVFLGNIKEHEYLFLYLLAKSGCDVLYLNPEGDANVNNKFLELSHLQMYPKKSKVSVPQYFVTPDSICKKVRPSRENIQISMPQKIIQKPTAAPKPDKSTPQKPLEYEELARIASSIVMISVFDSNNTCFKTGSGIMIGEDGYILTNFHVVNGGVYFSVRMEEDQNSYETDELLKYNQDFDLALIRIDKKLQAVRIYQNQKELVRGQKVVAIGSPLGLFNSVSDGIISGFRTINNQPMIQFTAPTSHGSSGGAVLNMYGELIGVSTAGIDDGQNLNLAVSYQTILPFVRGFVV